MQLLLMMVLYASPSEVIFPAQQLPLPRVRRHPRLARDLDQRPALQQALQCLFIQIQTSCTRRRHALSS